MVFAFAVVCSRQVVRRQMRVRRPLNGKYWVGEVLYENVLA